MTTTTPKTVKVSRVAIKGKSLDGTYPVAKIDNESVFITHPEHGSLRIPRANTDIPASVSAPLSYEELTQDIRDRFATLDDLIDGVVVGTTRALTVSGATGVGKTHAVEKKLRAALIDKKIKRFKHVRGTVSPIRLYKLLYENRHKGSVLILDDSDAIFYEEDGANIIKAATDSGKVRVISYEKEAQSLINEGIPNDFVFEGALIVSTNIDFRAEVRKGSKIAVHLSAVLGRALYLDLGLHSKQGLMARVEDVSRNTRMLTEIGLNTAQIDEVIGWLKDNQASVPTLSLRTAMLVAQQMLTHPDKWKRIAKTTLLEAVER